MRFKFKYTGDVLSVLLLLAITCIYIFSFFGADMYRIFGDLGDARLNNYFLEHGYQYIIGNHTSFWSAPFFYPAQYVMTYSDNHIGTLPFYALYRFIGLDIETSYQFWQLTIFIFNSLSAYCVLRLLKFNCLSSLVAALFFSISAPVMIKAGHFQLMPRFMVPFIFYGLIRFVETLKLKYIYIFCVAFVYQFYIGVYIGFFSVIAILVILPFAIFYISKAYGLKCFFQKRYIVGLSAGAMLSFIALYALFRPYIKFKESVGGRTWGEVSSMLPRLESWLYTNNGVLEYFNTIGSNLPMRHEHMMFVGILPIIAIVFGLLCWARNSVFGINDFKENTVSIISSLLIVTLVFVVTLYFDGFSIYKYLFFKLPGFDAIRAVTRIVLLLLFPLSILIAFLISSIYNCRNINATAKFILLSLVLAGGFLEQYRYLIPTYEKLEAQSRYVSVAKKLSKFNGYDVFYYQYQKGSDSFYIDELDAMFISLALNTKTINGYSGNKPVGYLLINNGRYDYWLNSNRGLIFDKIKVLKYDVNTEGASIDTVYKNNEGIAFTSSDVPLKDYSFNINLSDEYDSSIIELTIENNSGVDWPSIHNGMYGLAFSYGIKSIDGSLKYENRTFLPFDVSAGSKVKVIFNIEGLKKGRNDVCFNMVQDGVRWFVKDEQFCTNVVLK